ncbi:exodeoxyribonuclease VII small subunit [Demequina sp.]|uniref:exodeoxyribonuclease VII small subunit n=1 Tax=Demequina sp. TaxID=2050685 RepID=UPI0025F84AA0|nr:exodeoxyribonuclease VII small subunit [Demequina sp.]
MSDAAPTFDAPVDGLSYEDARDELIAIVARLEAGSSTLDDSLGLWERGEALAARCQALLDGAAERIAAARGDDAMVEDSTDAGVIAVVPDDKEDS